MWTSSGGASRPGEQAPVGQLVERRAAAVGWVITASRSKTCSPRRGRAARVGRSTPNSRAGGLVGVDEPAVAVAHDHGLAEHVEDALEAVARAPQLGDQLRVGEARGGALADARAGTRRARRTGRPRAGSRPKCSRPSSRSPSRSGTTTHQRMPVAAIVARVLGAGGDALDQVQRELGDVRAPVLQRRAGGGAGRVGARAQRGQPARVRAPSRRSGRRSAPGSPPRRSRRPRTRRRRPGRAGRRAAPPPPPATRPARRATTASSSSGSRASTCPPRAGPRTPGVANVIESSVPPPGGSRRSTCAASRPIVGSPSPSPGLSARGCIPRPLSVTTTVSSSAAVQHGHADAARARGR